MLSGSATQQKPVVFLAFANEHNGQRYLRDLPQEYRELRELFRGAKELGLCELEDQTNVTIDDIALVFKKYQGRIAIFHFGGHAGPGGLLLESPSGAAKTAYAEGLAGLMREYGAPRLVFLNGCATWAQVQRLHDAGVPAVIATARAICDDQARQLARVFYQRLAAGESLETAFRQAQAELRLGGDPATYLNRDLIVLVNQDSQLAPIGSTGEASERDLPWKLSFAQDATLAGEWSFRAFDPLWGLSPPTLPPPACAYLGLKPFTRQDAAVFFGRRAEIRELYDKVVLPGGPSLIFYFGSSGVGKSSVLDAGLVPWLSPARMVLYVRRDPELGLLGTLRYELAQTGGATSADPIPDLSALWEAAAARNADRPLVVILDQAEEAFTRPNRTQAAFPSTAATQTELSTFFDSLKGLLTGFEDGPKRRVLILGFRKEWQADFERAAREAGLTPAEVFLKPLGHRGVIEAIEGPSSVATLPRSKRPTIEAGLADEMARDLMEYVAEPERNRLYPLAPTLQILLERMLAEARSRNDDEPVFDRELFIAVKKKGYGLDHYLRRGLDALKTWRPEVVDSGLALDLLEYHTTPLGVAEQRRPEELQTRYDHRKDVLDSLIGECKTNYLLFEAPPPAVPGSTRLPHDTLAPVVRDEFSRSLRPGQRARRVLENRAADWQEGRKGQPLDGPDLQIVEAGKPGMRAWQDDEVRLVRASQKARRLRRTAFVCAALVGTVLLGLTIYSGLDAVQNSRKARVNLATSYLRAISHSDRDLSAIELDTLRELAKQEDSFVRFSLFEQALKSPTSARQFRYRVQVAVHCGVRLDPGMRLEVHKLVLGKLKETAASADEHAFEIRLTAALLGHKLRSERLPEGEFFSVQAFGIFTDPRVRSAFTWQQRDMQPRLSQILPSLYDHLPASRKTAAALRALELICSAGSSDSGDLLSGALKTFAPKLSSEVAAAVTERALELIPSASPRQVEELWQALTDLMPKLPDSVADEVRTALAVRAVTVVPTQIFAGPQHALMYLIPQLTPDGAAKVAGRVSEVVGSANSYQLQALLPALKGLPDELVGEAKAKAVERAVRLVLSPTTDQNQVNSAVTLLGRELAPMVRPGSVDALVVPTLNELASATDSGRATNLTHVLTALIPHLSEKGVDAAMVRVLEVLQSPHAGQLTGLLHAFQSLAPKVSGDGAAAAVSRILDLISPIEPNDQLGFSVVMQTIQLMATVGPEGLMQEFAGNPGSRPRGFNSVLASKLPADRASEIATRALKQVKSANSAQLALLSQVLGILPEGTAIEAQAAAADRTGQLIKSADLTQFWMLAQGLGKLPKRLAGDAWAATAVRARELLKSADMMQTMMLLMALRGLPDDVVAEMAPAAVIRLMEQSPLVYEQSVGRALSQALDPMLPKLSAEGATAVAARALDLVHSGSAGQREAVSYVLPALAPKLSPKGMAAVSSQMGKLIQSANPNQLESLSRAIDKLQSETLGETRTAAALRALDLVPLTRQDQHQTLLQVLGIQFPKLSAESRAKVVARYEQLTKAGGMRSEQGWFLGMARMVRGSNQRGRSGGDRAPSRAASGSVRVAEDLANMLRDISPQTVPSGTPNERAGENSTQLPQKPPLSAPEDLAAVALRTLKQIDDTDDVESIRKKLNILCDLARKLPPAVLIQIIRDPCPVACITPYHITDITAQSEFLVALQLKFDPKPTDYWANPWDLVDWLKIHRTDSRESRGLERLLLEPAS